MIATSAADHKLARSDTTTTTIRKSSPTVVGLTWNRKEIKVSKASAPLPLKNSIAESQNPFELVNFLCIESDSRTWKPSQRYLYQSTIDSLTQTLLFKA